MSRSPPAPRCSLSACLRKNRKPAGAGVFAGRRSRRRPPPHSTTPAARYSRSASWFSRRGQLRGHRRSQPRRGVQRNDAQRMPEPSLWRRSSRSGWFRDFLGFGARGHNDSFPAAAMHPPGLGRPVGAGRARGENRRRRQTYRRGAAMEMVRTYLDESPARWYNRSS